MKCEGSGMRLCKLNCWQMLFILLPDACFKMSRLKSPTMRISLISVSHARPIEFSIDFRMGGLEVGGL